jgi:hypothetical protein
VNTNTILDVGAGPDVIGVTEVFITLHLSVGFELFELLEFSPRALDCESLFDVLRLRIFVVGEILVVDREVASVFASKTASSIFVQGRSLLGEVGHLWILCQVITLLRILEHRSHNRGGRFLTLRF